MSTTAIAPNNTLGALQNLLEKHKAQIEVALPRHMKPERMIRVVLTAVSQTPALAKCTPVSIAAAVVQASILGLEPASVLGEAYLVPFYNGKTKQHECQLIPGYQGLIKLTRNSGAVSMFDSQIVYSNDEFDFHKGSDVWWKHKWARSGDRGEPEGVWAGYVLKDGSKNFEYWTLDQIERHRDRYSKGAYKTEYGKFVLDNEGNKILVGAWADSSEWMWKKTVIRQIVKLMPKSVELSTALSLDELNEVGQPQTFDVLPVLPAGEGEQPLIEDETEPPAPTEGPKRKSETKATEQPNKPVEPTPAADMDPKKVKPLVGTLEELEGMRKTLGDAAWWQVLGNAGMTALHELKTQAEAVMLLGVMRSQAKA